jgi:hypothetical protein
MQPSASRLDAWTSLIHFEMVSFCAVPDSRWAMGANWVDALPRPNSNELRKRGDVCVAGWGSNDLVAPRPGDVLETTERAFGPSRSGGTDSHRRSGSYSGEDKKAHGEIETEHPERAYLLLQASPRL